MESIVNFTHFNTLDGKRLAMAMRVITPDLIGIEVGVVGGLKHKYANEDFIWIEDKTELDAYVSLYHTESFDKLFTQATSSESVKRYINQLIP